MDFRKFVAVAGLTTVARPLWCPCLHEKWYFLLSIIKTYSKIECDTINATSVSDSQGTAMQKQMKRYIQ